MASNRVPPAGATSATTSSAGIVQLTDSTSSTSTTTAATPNAVKSAFDLANGAIAKTLTTTTGDIIYASSANTPARLGIGSTNQVLTVSGGVPAWATVSSGGLVLIGTTSFSAASAVNINDVFSSTYDNYRIVCNFTPSDNGDLNFRYRVSGADNTTSNYYYQGIDIAGTSSTPFRLGAQTNGRLAAAQTNVENSFSADMFAPNLTRKKRTNSYAGRETNSSPGIVFLSTTFDATTSFTGFSLYNNNGTITGTVSVYGYAK